MTEEQKFQKQNPKTIAMKQMSVFLLLPIFLIVSYVFIVWFVPNYYRNIYRPTGVCVNMVIPFEKKIKKFSCDFKILKQDSYVVQLLLKYDENEKSEEKRKQIVSAIEEGKSLIGLEVYVSEHNRKIIRKKIDSLKITSHHLGKYYSSVILGARFDKGDYVLTIQKEREEPDLEGIETQIDINYSYRAK